MFPSPYGEKVSGKPEDYKVSVAKIITFPSPYGEKVSGKGR